VIFPYVLVAPAYFAQKIQLGGMMQTASAFSNVQGAFSYFVSIYRQLAEWQAVVNRLDGFEAGISAASNLARRGDRIDIAAAQGDGSISLQDLVVQLPDGTPLVNVDQLGFRKGERTLMTGPSGAGKSTLFRAISGIWPFGEGVIEIPANASLMMLPQRPYLPIGTLHAAIVYPGEDASFSADRVSEVLNEVGLPKFAARLDEEAHWNRMLSLGEQQRLGLARALLHTPSHLFLDEATASLDEPSEAALYTMLIGKLPQTTIVSIGHRATLEAFHERNVTLVRDGDRFTLQEGKPA